MIKNCKACNKQFKTKWSPDQSYCRRQCYFKDAKNISPKGKDCHNFIQDEDVPSFEIKDELSAYFLGFLQTDGTLDHKRATIEINESDKDILYLFAEKIGGSVSFRTRDTNFKKETKLGCWRFGSVAFVKKMNRLGIPCGKKSDIVGPISMPKELERHYIRGLIDGDGSLCISAQNIPIIGFVTSSEKMKKYFQKWLSSIGIETRITRNTRDGIYNFSSSKEKAQVIAKILYDGASCGLKRKQEIAQKILSWKRPVTTASVG